MLYWRHPKSDTWHFCENCSHVRKMEPLRVLREARGQVGFVIRESKPQSGEFCNECLSKRKRGTC